MKRSHWGLLSGCVFALLAHAIPQAQKPVPPVQQSVSPAPDAQQQKPAQTPPAEIPLNDEAQQTPAPPPPPGAYHLEQKVQLVTIPALVTDRAGNHVPGLKASDFVVKDNGKVRQLKMVEEIVVPPNEVLERAKLPPGTFTNDTLHPKAPLRIVIILFDMLNSHFKDQVPARIELTKYLNEKIEPGTMVALLGLGRGGLRMYHDLTSDTAGLGKEMEDAMETGRHSISTNLQGETSETEAEQAFVGHGGFEQTSSSGRSSRTVIVLDTLAAFKNIAGAYGGLPGRKSLIWVTTGFPLTLDASKSKNSSGTTSLDQDSFQDLSTDYEATWQALNNANIAMYPVDMHGLLNTAQPDATYRAKKGGDSTNSKSLGKFTTEKQNRSEDSTQSMTSFASETGGKAFYNNNDLVTGFREAVADSKSSYLLGYYLDADATPGWHKLQVSVTKPGVHVRAREGFLVQKPGKVQQQTQTSTGTQPRDTPETLEVKEAMSAPVNYTGITMTLKWLDPSTVKQPAEATNNKRIVPFQIILPPNSTALDANGTHMSLKVIGLALSTRGEDAADFIKDLNGTLKPDVAKRLQLAGIKFDSMLQLAPGYYNVRFVVRDNVSGLVGSVTAPVTVK